MLAANSNDVMVTQVIASLWNHYKTYHYNTDEYHKPHYKKYDCEDGRSTPDRKFHRQHSVHKRLAPKPPQPSTNL